MFTIVELHVTVHKINVLGVAQQCFYRQFFYIADNNKTYSCLHSQCPIVTNFEFSTQTVS